LKLAKNSKSLLELGVGISRFRRKLEENFVGRSEVGKVDNFTDFTDRPFILTPTDTDFVGSVLVD
jgi:hypothetical protein